MELSHYIHSDKKHKSSYPGGNLFSRREFFLNGPQLRYKCETLFPVIKHNI